MCYYVLVITSSFDEHADLLCPKIERMGAGVFRFDTDNLSRYEISLLPTDPVLCIIDKETGSSVVADQIRSVWYRRPSPDRNYDEILDDESLRLFKSETKEWIKSISLALKHANWIIAPPLLYQARVKANQLLVSHEVGLRIPKTIVTNDRKQIAEFFSQCPDGVIAKTLRAPYVEGKDMYYTLRTQELRKSDLADPSLYICPVTLQEKIRTQHELRVVAIGERLFPFKVMPKGKYNTDIRSAGPANIEYAYCSISTELENKIRSLLGKFSLPFSSMDLLVDWEGREFFVDLNPNGQWLWLEYATGIDLSTPFIEMLIAGLPSE